MIQVYIHSYCLQTCKGICICFVSEKMRFIFFLPSSFFSHQPNPNAAVLYRESNCCRIKWQDVMMAQIFLCAPEADRNTFCFHSGFSALHCSLFFRMSHILGGPLIKPHYTKASQQHPNMRARLFMLLSWMLSLFMLIIYIEGERVSRMLNDD